MIYLGQDSPTCNGKAAMVRLCEVLSSVLSIFNYDIADLKAQSLLVYSCHRNSQLQYCALLD